MILEELKLVNIRSYEHALISFEEGLTLLAGDIGAGKSTILLALEFGLFGTRRGDIGGEGLLRRGEQEGSVTVTINAEGPLTIHRALKRTSGGVRQESGWIESDGRREELTASELKARVFERLGYPEALVNKTKGLVFRYTVYTPQEEMKQILSERADARLDTLRSVFGVDQYRTVTENAGMVAKILREQQRYLEGQVAEIADLENEERELKKRIKDLEESLDDKRLSCEAAQEAFTAAEQKAQRLQEAYEAYQERVAERESHKARIQSLSEQQERIVQDLERLSQIKEPEGDLEDPSEQITHWENEREGMVQKRAQAEARLAHLRRELQELSRPKRAETLEECPVCEQPVTEDHKHSLKEERTRQKGEKVAQAKDLEEYAEKARRNLEKISERLQQLRSSRALFEEHNSQRRRFEEAVKERERLAAHARELAKEQRLLSEKLEKLSAEGFDMDGYKAHRVALETLRTEHQKAQVAKARAEEALAAYVRELGDLQKRLSEKRKRKKELQDRRSKERWLVDGFLPVVSEIERRVLGSIHAEFSRRFTAWFSALVADDALFASLSEDFSPVLTQDGYDADVAHLSGGERTAVALAYRLALNTVVNEFITSIRTNDVLVLDEPTDGFSAEQLDRVRDVIRELPNRQVIIVSHEQKMEALVDRVLRVEKVGGVSGIA